MDDKYRNFAELAENEREGIDYRICVSKRENSPIAVIAPHGGSIEPHTSKIASTIAGGLYNLYLFEGIKRNGNRDLHITSTNFDEPQCRELIAASDLVITIHGKEGTRRFVQVGGQNDDLRQSVCEFLKKAGFEGRQESKGSHTAALSSENPCNQGRRFGIQLEISRGMRDFLANSKNRDQLLAFAEAVRKAIEGCI